MIYLPVGMEMGSDNVSRTGIVEVGNITHRVPMDEYFVYLMLRMGGVDSEVLGPRIRRSFTAERLQTTLETLAKQHLVVPAEESTFATLLAIPTGYFVGHRQDGYALAQILENDTALPIGRRPYILWSVLSSEQPLATIFANLERDVSQVPKADWVAALIALAKLRLVMFQPLKDFE